MSERGHKDSSPMGVLRESILAVPAMKYALAAVSLIACVAIVKAWGLDIRLAFLGAFGFLFLMVGVLLFAKLSTSSKPLFALPATVLMWFSLVLIIALSVLLVMSVFFTWPMDLSHWVTTTSQHITSDDQPIQHVNCVFDSNYKYLYFDSDMAEQEKIRKLNVTVGFRNISTSVIKNIELDIYASPILLHQEIYPFAEDINEVFLFGKTKPFLPSMELYEVPSILEDITDSVKKQLFFKNDKGILKSAIGPQHADILKKAPILSGEGRLRGIYLSHVKNNWLSSQPLGQSTVDNCGGLMGLALRLFLRYEVDGDEVLMMYFGGLYYTTASFRDGEVCVPFPYLLYDYLTVAPKGLRKKFQRERYRLSKVLDETTYPLDRLKVYRPELLFLGARFAQGEKHEILVTDIPIAPCWVVKSYLQGGSFKMETRDAGTKSR